MSQNQSGKIIKDQSSLGQFSSAIAQICEEKGIDKDKVIISIEAALAAAYKKDYGKKGQIILAKMDENTSETSFKQLKEVVDETTRTIEEEYIPEDVHKVPAHAIKSSEVIEKHPDRSYNNDEEEVNLPKFNSERDVLLEDAKKVIKGIKLGDYIEYSLDIQDQYGRIASQTAKQVIIQKIREAEREAMYEEFKGREGELINGTVQRIESGKVFIDLGKSVGVLFQSEQIPGEAYRVGQRLKLYIDKVDSDPRSLGIVLSRKHPQLLAKLFELEVPEIFAGTVEIKAVAREAGMRSKIAVVSHEEGIDPVGSCVGQKGTRVQAIIDELNGEKIDIIEWEDDPEAMITQALSPAKVVQVELLGEPQEEEAKEDKKSKKAKKTTKKDDEEEVDKDEDEGEKKEEVSDKREDTEKKAVAYVKDDQLSLAIGKRGQNVRLAAKLTGWNINVEALEAEDKEIEDKEDDLENSKEDDKSKEEEKDSSKSEEKSTKPKKEKKNKKGKEDKKDGEDEKEQKEEKEEGEEKKVDKGAEEEKEEIKKEKKEAKK